MTARRAPSEKQGRSPYASARKSIKACTTIRAAKAWISRVDTLIMKAAARGDQVAMANAKRLRLHAYRRMSQIADLLQPRTYVRGKGTKGHAQQPGPFALLLARGVPKTAAQQMRRIGSIPSGQFETLIKMKNPPGVMKAAALAVGVLAPTRTSAAWREIVNGRMTSSISLQRFVARFCRVHRPMRLAHGLNAKEARAAERLAEEAQVWLNSFLSRVSQTKDRRQP